MKVVFPHGGVSPTLDAAARYRAPGAFIDLSDGTVHYEIAGPLNGQPVVLIHGFSVPDYIWDPTFAALADAGFRVLRYDLYGRGFSDRPETAYNPDLFDRQLLQLLTALNFPLPADLIGVSMGGVIAARFTDRHPAETRRLCLIDPAGVAPRPSLASRLETLPVLGELHSHFFAEKILLSRLFYDFFRPDRVSPDYVDNFREQMYYRGYKRALLSTLRHGLLHGAAETYRRIGQQKRATLLIWGRQDRTIPFTDSLVLRKLIPDIEFHPIDEAGHIPHYECPERVHPILIDFLTRISLKDCRTRPENAIQPPCGNRISTKPKSNLSRRFQ
jgi:pimeloyl-ACP methyl ester carboxylesterase